MWIGGKREVEYNWRKISGENISLGRSEVKSTKNYSGSKVQIYPSSGLDRWEERSGMQLEKNLR